MLGGGLKTKGVGIELYFCNTMRNSLLASYKMMMLDNLDHLDVRFANLKKNVKEVHLVWNVLKINLGNGLLVLINEAYFLETC